MKENNPVAEKSKAFAIRTIRLYQSLTNERKEYVLSRQVLKSGTSIGANVKEAAGAQSKADFISKMHIALKEANETEYWLELLGETGYLTDADCSGFISDCQELIKLITRIIKTAKESGTN